MPDMQSQGEKCCRCAATAKKGAQRLRPLCRSRPRVCHSRQRTTPALCRNGVWAQAPEVEYTKAIDKDFTCRGESRKLAKNSCSADLRSRKGRGRQDHHLGRVGISFAAEV